MKKMEVNVVKAAVGFALKHGAEFNKEYEKLVDGGNPFVDASDKLQSQWERLLRLANTNFACCLDGSNTLQTACSYRFGKNLANWGYAMVNCINWLSAEAHEKKLCHAPKHITCDDAVAEGSTHDECLFDGECPFQSKTGVFK